MFKKGLVKSNLKKINLNENSCLKFVKQNLFLWKYKNWVRVFAPPPPLRGEPELYFTGPHNLQTGSEYVKLVELYSTMFCHYITHCCYSERHSGSVPICSTEWLRKFNELVMHTTLVYFSSDFRSKITTTLYRYRLQR